MLAIFKFEGDKYISALVKIALLYLKHITTFF